MNNFQRHLIRNLHRNWSTIKATRLYSNSRVKRVQNLAGLWPSGNVYVQNLNLLKKTHLFMSTKTPDNGVEEETKKEEKEEENENLSPSTASQFIPFKDEDAQVIFDVDEEMTKLEEIPEEEEVYLYRERKQYKKTKADFLNMARGQTGVFDIDQLVDLLRSEKTEDIAVIHVPKELRYTDYLVLATVKSKRHINALCEFILKVYKRKKSKEDPFVTFENQTTDWRVLDMNNIVLHLFQRETREHYDIETLWTVGHEFDEKMQRPEVDPVLDIMEKHIQYLQELQPAN